jgi:hypothetical protein
MDLLIVADESSELTKEKWDRLAEKMNVPRPTICSGCQKPNHRVGQRYCHSCHAAYMREQRKKPRACPHCGEEI